MELDRLEYGKVCESLLGPSLEHAESGALAASSGFPPELKQACTPQAWGLGDSPSGIRAARQFGSTFFVGPFLTREGMVRVGARFRRRSVTGEGEKGREFWRARFLCEGTSDSDVASLGVTLSADPLLGWTAADVASPVAASSVAPLDLLASALPGLDVAAWCARAARAIEQRIRVGILGSLSSDSFFCLAAALEAALPKKLRPLFSAGWGVSGARSSGLALSWGEEFPAGIAVYHCQTGSWSPTPEEVASAGPAPTDAAAADGAIDRAANGARLVGFSDPQVQRWIRGVWSESAAEQRLAMLRDWLAGAGSPDPVPAELVDPEGTRGFEPLLALLGDALADPERATRGEAMLVALLSSPARESIARAIHQLARPPEMGLILAVLERDAHKLLLALSGAREPLLPWTGRHLPAALDAGMVASAPVAEASARLLTAERIPSVYSSWLALHAAEQALILATLAPEDLRKPALEALIRDVPTPPATTLWQLLYGDPQPVEVLARHLDAAPSAWRPLLSDIARRRWGTVPDTRAEDRSAVLGWLWLLAALPDDPLLRRGAPAPKEVGQIANAIREACVPPELLTGIARRALRYWPAFEGEVSGYARLWESVLSCWSVPVQRLLLPGVRLDAPPPGTEVVPGRGERDALRWVARDLERRGRSAFLGTALEDSERTSVAALFVEWCRDTIGPFDRAELVGLVRWLWHGSAPSVGQPSDEVTVIATGLLADLPLSDEQKRERWRDARTAADLLLLARLFGGPVEEPSAPVLVSLLGRRKELARLTAMPTFADSKDALQICGEDWQSLDVRKGGQRSWRPQYRGTMIAGVFAGLAPDDEPPMSEMLAFFGKRFNRSPVALASRYIGQRGEIFRRDGTVDRLWREVVEKECLAAELDCGQFDEVLRFSESTPTSRRPLVEVDRRSSDFPVLIGEKGRVLVQPEMANLLRELGDRAQHSARLAAYDVRLRQMTGLRDGLGNTPQPKSVRQERWRS